jgi:hypothetical protein
MAKAIHYVTGEIPQMRNAHVSLAACGHGRGGIAESLSNDWNVVTCKHCLRERAHIERLEARRDAE